MNQIEDKRKIRQISSIGQIFAPEITRTISIYARAPRDSLRHHRRAEKTNAGSLHRKKTAQERIPCAENK